MRALVGLTAAAMTLFAASAATAPVTAPGYEIEIVNRPGATLSGLARDGDALLVTDLANGRLYRRGPAGEFAAFGPILPHGLDVIGDPTGPYRVARLGSQYLVTQGWTPVDREAAPYDHSLLAVNASGAVKVISTDFWNPFDFIASGDAIYVIDAARNSVERLKADGSGQRTLFTFLRLSQGDAALRSLSPTEFSGNESYEFDAVPTGMAIHDGRLYVSLFGGFPFITGSGRIVSLSLADEEPSSRLEFENLNAPVAIAFDSAGRLLVLEHGVYDPATGFLPGSGRLLSIDGATGERRVLVEGLTRPADVLVFDERLVVVSQLDGTLVYLRRKP